MTFGTIDLMAPAGASFLQGAHASEQQSIKSEEERNKRAMQSTVKLLEQGWKPIDPKKGEYSGQAVRFGKGGVWLRPPEFGKEEAAQFVLQQKKMGLELEKLRHGRQLSANEYMQYQIDLQKAKTPTELATIAADLEKARIGRDIAGVKLEIEKITGPLKLLKEENALKIQEGLMELQETKGILARQKLFAELKALAARVKIAEAKKDRTKSVVVTGVPGTETASNLYVGTYDPTQPGQVNLPPGASNLTQSQAQRLDKELSNIMTTVLANPKKEAVLPKLDMYHKKQAPAMKSTYIWHEGKEKVVKLDLLYENGKQLTMATLQRRAYRRGMTINAIINEMLREYPRKQKKGEL